MKVISLIFLVTLVLAPSCTSVPFFINSDLSSDRVPASRVFGSCLENFRYLAKISKNRNLSSTVGFEFEGSLPIQISYLDVAKRVKEKVSKLYPDRVIELEEVDYDYGLSDYKVLIKNESETLIISVKADMSLYFEDKSLNGIEITSPVMRTHNDYMNFLTVLEDLKELNLKARQDVGGIHFHYGLPLDRTYAELVPLYEVFAKSYDSLLNYFKANPGRGFQDVDKFLESFNQLKKVASDMPELPIRSYQVGALHSRSILRVLPTINTWEIRFFNSTLDPEINEFYREFSDRLYSLWLNRDPSLQKFLDEHESIEAKELMSFLGFKTSETDRLMAKLRVEEREIEEANPLDQEVAHFWTHSEFPKSITSPLFYRLVLDDSRLNNLTEELQSETFRRAREFAHEFPVIEEKIMLFDLFKNPQGFKKNFKSTLERIENENIQYLYQAFHLALIRDGEDLIARIGELDDADRKIFLINLLKDFTKSSQTRGVLKSKVLKSHYLSLITQASDSYQNEETLRSLLKIFPLFQGMESSPLPELTTLANNTVDIILKIPKRDYDYTGLLSFVNRNNTQINKRVALGDLLKELLLEKPNFNIFYSFSDFLKTNKDDLLTSENIQFMTEYATKLAPNLDRTKIVNLILLYKEMLGSIAEESDRLLVEEVLEKLRALKD